MANILSTDKKIAVIGALAEGSSIRSIERITGIHRDTIMRLGVKVGQCCTALMDETMQDLPCTRQEMDEIWGMTHIQELRDVIHHLHGAHASHVESVPVTETFQGQTVWDGVVEVFDLKGHPKTHRVYAWMHDTGDPAKPKRHVTVLHIPPVVSPQTAVKAAIVQEFKDRGKTN